MMGTVTRTQLIIMNNNDDKNMTIASKIFDGQSFTLDQMTKM